VSCGKRGTIQGREAAETENYCRFIMKAERGKADLTCEEVILELIKRARKE